MVWLQIAKKYIGQKEIKGIKHNSLILNWWKSIRSAFTNDETPWCAAFVGGVLEEAGIKSSRSASARSYLKWGKPLKVPAVGCVVVFWRDKPTGAYGHVGFLAGTDQQGKLMVLGGNQGDAVNIKPFPWSRVLGFRWPDGDFIPEYRLPLIHSDGTVSSNEA